VLNARPTSPIDHPPKRVKIPISPVCSGAPKPRSTSSFSREKHNSSEQHPVEKSADPLSHRPPRHARSASGSFHQVEVQTAQACEASQATHSAVRGKRKSPLTFRSVGSSQRGRGSSSACSHCTLNVRRG
jgi:hypothetical protein